MANPRPAAVDLSRERSLLSRDPSMEAFLTTTVAINESLDVDFHLLKLCQCLLQVDILGV